MEIAELVASLDPRGYLRPGERREIHPDPAVLAASPTQTTLTPDLSLTATLEFFLRDNTTELPDIATPWRMTLLGTIFGMICYLALQDRCSGSRP